MRRPLSAGWHRNVGSADKTVIPLACAIVRIVDVTPVLSDETEPASENDLLAGLVDALQKLFSETHPFAALYQRAGREKLGAYCYAKRYRLDSQPSDLRAHLRIAEKRRISHPQTQDKPVSRLKPAFLTTLPLDGLKDIGGHFGKIFEGLMTCQL